MGLFDKKSEPTATPSDDVVTKLVSQLLSVGIDGLGPIPSAAKVADKALKKAKGNRDDAVKAIIAEHTQAATVGGFVTGVGGFFTLPVALPANVLEFYVISTHMVAAVAHLRGYDLSQPGVRAAVLLVLTGAKADEVLHKVGMGGSLGGSITQIALGKAPAAALMVINKGVGFQIVKATTTKLLPKLGKGIPVAGGVIGGGLDAWMINRIARHARKEFPKR